MSKIKKYEVTLEFNTHTIDLVHIEVKTSSSDHDEIVHLAKQEYDRMKKNEEDIEYIVSDFFENSYRENAESDFQIEEVQNENS